MNCEIDILRLKMIRQTESFLEHSLNETAFPPAPPRELAEARRRRGNRRRTGRQYSVRFDAQRTCTSSHDR